MPYAIKDKLSQDPIAGGIEITEAQYVEARDKMPLGWQVDVRDGELFLLSPIKRKVYSTADGSELEIPENETTPDDYTELERPDSYHEWNGTDWFECPVKLWERIRQHRDGLIRASDWTEVSRRLTPEQKQAWQDYRDVLFDLPDTQSHVTSFDDIVWPEKPE